MPQLIIPERKFYATPNIVETGSAAEYPASGFVLKLDREQVRLVAYIRRQIGDGHADENNVTLFLPRCACKRSLLTACLDWADAPGLHEGLH